MGTVFSQVRGRAGIATAMTMTLTLASSSPAAAQQSGAASASTARLVAASATYDAVLDGMVCRQQKSGRMDCDYRVGRSVRFVIAGVGQEDVVVSFVQADTAGEYAASIVPLHGCVVVKPMRPADGSRASQLYLADSVATFAYVSPKTGKVYHTWAACLNATRAEARAQPDTKADTKADTKVDGAKAAATKTPPPETKPPPAKPPR